MKTFSALRDVLVNNRGSLGMVLVGLLIFSGRFPLPSSDFVNLPIAATMVQMAGLMFMIYGMQMIASAVFWPQIRVSILMERVEAGNVAAGIVVGALLLFNGMSVIGFCIWLLGSFGGVSK